MSKELKIWLVIMAVYLGLIGGMGVLISRVESPIPGQISGTSLPHVSNAITFPDNTWEI